MYLYIKIINSAQLTEDTNKDIDQFNQPLLESTEKFIGISRNTIGHIHVPWWNEICGSAIRASKSDLNTYTYIKQSNLKLN